MSEEAPRVRASVWRLGLAGSLVTVFAASAFAYAFGLPAVFDEVPWLDKIVHFSVFGGIAFFLDAVLRRRMLGPLPLAAVLVIVPAGIEEFLQRYSENRSSDVKDLLADIAGVTFLVWLSRRLDR